MNAARAAGNTRVHQETLCVRAAWTSGPLGRRRVAARPRFLLLVIVVIVVADEEEREHSQNAADENSDGFALQGGKRGHVNHVTFLTRFKTLADCDDLHLYSFHCQHETSQMCFYCNI